MLEYLHSQTTACLHSLFINSRFNDDSMPNGQNCLCHQLFLLPELDYYSFFLKCFSHMTYNNTASTKVVNLGGKNFPSERYKSLVLKMFRSICFFIKTNCTAETTGIMCIIHCFRCVCQLQNNRVRQEECPTFSQPRGTNLNDLYSLRTKTFT